MSGPILIVTEASPLIGIGHARRSLTLARALSAKVPVEFWLLGSDSGYLGDLLSEFPLRCGPVPDFASTALAVLDLEQDAHRLAMSLEPRSIALDYFQHEKLPLKTINLLDHSGRMRQAYADEVRPEDYFEGPAYAIIRPSLLAQRRVMDFSDVKNILVTIGGADPSGRTLDALREVPASASVTIVLGPLVSSGLEDEIRSISGEAALVRNPQNFDALLGRADLVLTNGGTTLLESMALGKPTIALPQTPAEAAHAAFHERAGACAPLGRLAEILSSASARESLSATARDTVDGLGVDRIVSEILESASCASTQ